MFTCRPSVVSSVPVRVAAACPAVSGSKLTMTFAANLRSNRACCAVTAVPQVATTGSTPACTTCARSKYPSTITAYPSRRIAALVRCKPYNVRLFVYSSDSGEFMYFGCWPDSSARPPNATTAPLSRQIGIISRFRKRSSTRPPSLSTTSPLSSSRSGCWPASSRCRRRPSRWAGAYPSPRRSIVSGRMPRASRCARAPPAGRPGQLLLKPGGGQAVHLEQRLAAGVGGRVALGIGGLGHLDAEALGEQPHRFGKRKLLVQLDELDDIAPGAAAEALEEPLVLIHVERRRLFVVERTQTLVRVAGLLQRDDVLHDLDDVGLRLEVVDELGRKASHC